MRAAKTYLTFVVNNKGDKDNDNKAATKQTKTVQKELQKQINE